MSRYLRPPHASQVGPPTEEGSRRQARARGDLARPRRLQREPARPPRLSSSLNSTTHPTPPHYHHHHSLSMMLPQVSVPSRRAALRSALTTPATAPLRQQRSLSCLASAAAAPVAPRLQQRSSAASLRFSSLRSSASPIAPSAARCFHASQIFAAETVKVPQMAESISEGTLKQWNKKKGDFVKADEEVAVIETDKVRPSRGD